MVQTATVTQVDFDAGMVKVSLPDRDNIESNWLPVTSSAYSLPEAGSRVMVAFDEDNYSTGLCLGNFFHGKNPPVHAGPTLYYRKMGPDVTILYDSAEKTLTVQAQTIRLQAAEVEIQGSLSVTGNLKAGGLQIGGEASVGGNLRVSGSVSASNI